MQTHDVVVRVKYDHRSDKLHPTEITVSSTVGSALILTPIGVLEGFSVNLRRSI